MKPNFLVLGAPKCGTTWLHICLAEHPEIYLPKAKEIHFFSYDNLYAKGNGWYESFFPDTLTEKAIGECSPSYLSAPKASQRIHEYLPDAQLICLLRNPIERAYSHYCMDLRTGRAPQDMSVGLGANSPYVKWGLYYEQISQYRQLFPSNQLKILLFDQLKRQPSELLKEIYQFLNVDPTYTSRTTNTPKNTKKSLPRFPTLYRNLQGIYNQLISFPLARDILIPLRLNGFFDFFHQLNQGEDLPKIPPERGKFLADYYTSDLRALSNHMGQDFSNWIEPYGGQL